MFDRDRGYTCWERRDRGVGRDTTAPHRPATDGYSARIARASKFLSRWMLGLLLASYALAAFLPASAVWGTELHFGESSLLGEPGRITLSMVLLTLLLFNVGLDIPLTHLGDQVRKPGLLLAGLGANLVFPVFYIAGLALFLGDGGAVASLILGLALIASMPIAGSSAAWAQTANGNMALTLGLILCSTVLSPLTTPVLLHSVGWLTRGDYSAGLDALANSGTSMFLSLFVLLPATLGLIVRRLVGDGRVSRVKPTLKLLNSVILLLLTYTNASTSLPGVVAQPDWRLLLLALFGALGMCVLSFAVGWILARFMRAGAGDCTALMFGLGMNNNGTGLVFAATVLRHMPEVMLPVICYNLIQHVIAGAVTHLTGRPMAAPVTAPMVAPATVAPSMLVSHPESMPIRIAS